MEKIQVKSFQGLKYRNANLLKRLLFILTMGEKGDWIEEYSEPIGYLKDFSINENFGMELEII